MTTAKTLKATRLVLMLSIVLFGGMAAMENANAGCYVRHIKKVKIGPNGGRHVYVWNQRICR